MKLHETAWALVLLFAIPSFPCGTERWAVKTSADKDADKVNTAVPITTTVANLVTIAAPTRAELDAKPDSRFAAELHAYTVQGYLVGFKRETDEDFHIVIADLAQPKTTMIVEIPAGDCMPTTDGGSLSASSLRNEAVKLQASWQARFGKATAKFKNVAVHKMKVEITGVGFFDFLHGQTGVAPNGFELHRVIAWKEIH